MSTSSPGQRAAAYWFVDGLPDILFGMTLLISGSLGCLWRIYAPEAWTKFYFYITTGGFLLFYWKGHDVLDFLKSHITYPRTGYVQPPEEFQRPQTLITLSLRPGPPADENVTFFAKRTVMVIFWFFFLSFNHNPLGNWLVPVVMPVLATTLYVANRSSERRYPWWS